MFPFNFKPTAAFLSPCLWNLFALPPSAACFRLGALAFVLTAYLFIYSWRQRQCVLVSARIIEGSCAITRCRTSQHLSLSIHPPTLANSVRYDSGRRQVFGPACAPPEPPGLRRAPLRSAGMSKACSETARVLFGRYQ